MPRGRPTRPAIERFWQKVDRTNGGCWEWTACLFTNGYGCFWDGRKNVSAHRFAYEQAKGSIPEGFQLDHLCHNPQCVNPQHLEVVTQTVNILRSDGPSARGARAMHCPKGHPYNEENTIIRKEGWRECKICKKEANLRRNRKAINNEKAGLVTNMASPAEGGED